MDATGRCPQCGTEQQSAGSSHGLCPACLMKLGLSGAIPVLEEPIAEDRAQECIETPEVPPPPLKPAHTLVPRAASWRERVIWLSALTILMLGAAGLFRAWLPERRAPEARLAIVTPATLDPVSLAISPDGQKVVFAAVIDGRPQLWLRPMDSVSPRPLSGTEGASYPFWSPDSRNVGFFADGRLKRIGIDGGSAQTLTNAPPGAGGTWNAQGDIVFAGAGHEPLARVPARGGQAAPLSRLDVPRETGHRLPQFLPDGRHLLYYVAGDPEARGIYVLSTDSGERRRLLDADSAAVYEHTGHLLFVREGTLFGLGFDPRRLEIVGDPFPVADRLAVNAQTHVAAVSTSASGPIVYRTGRASELRQFVWFDRDGRINPLGEPDSIGGQALSPDGRRIAFHKSVNGNTDIWLLDTARDVVSRFTFDPAYDALPVWSPDGNTVLFHSTRKSSSGIYQKSANGAGSEKLLLDAQGDTVATDWSPDGRLLIYQSRNADSKTGWDIWEVALEGDRKPRPVVQTPFDEVGAQFSPDGSWIAYQSNESGRFEIYVRSFPGSDALLQVSNGGGVQPRWRRDGRELFFVAPDGMLMAVAVRLMRGSTIESGLPVRMFDARLGAAPSGSEPQYAVSPDGRRFLLNTVTGDATEPLTVILNWKAGR